MGAQEVGRGQSPQQGHGSASGRPNIFPSGGFTEQKNSVRDADRPLPVNNSISRDGGGRFKIHEVAMNSRPLFTGPGQGKHLKPTGTRFIKSSQGSAIMFPIYSAD